MDFTQIVVAIIFYPIYFYLLLSFFIYIYSQRTKRHLDDKPFFGLKIFNKKFVDISASIFFTILITVGFSVYFFPLLNNTNNSINIGVLALMTACLIIFDGNGKTFIRFGRPEGEIKTNHEKTLLKKTEEDKKSGKTIINSKFINIKAIDESKIIIFENNKFIIKINYDYFVISLMATNQINPNSPNKDLDRLISYLVNKKNSVTTLKIEDLPKYAGHMVFYNIADILETGQVSIFYKDTKESLEGYLMQEVNHGRGKISDASTKEFLIGDDIILTIVTTIS